MITAVDTAELIDTSPDNSMRNFSADGVEEETTGTNVEPNILKVEIRDYFDPELGWK